MVSHLFNFACWFFFALEMYHMIVHVMIMFGLRTLPRKDLVRVRYYFLIDAFTVFTSSFLLTGRMKWLAVIQIIQHLFYYITWDKSHLAKKIIDWSCLDWFYKEEKQSQLDSFMGTFFDVVVHSLMMYAISEHLNLTGILLAFILTQVGLYFVIFNPRFAWTSPKHVPEWVKKRVNVKQMK